MSPARAHRWIWWLLSLLLAVGLLVAHNWEQQYIKRSIEGVEQQGAYPIKRDNKSSTGYKDGQRSQVLSLDGCHWVMQTQIMLADGHWRLRKVQYDNAPEGREVHWSSSLHWWLGGLGWVWSTSNGVPLGLAVEEMAPYASPLMLLCIMVVLLPYVWRMMGAAVAGILGLGMVLVGPFSEMFELGDPDHHGLAAVCGLLTVFFLTIGGGGWIRTEGAARVDDHAAGLKSVDGAKRCFIASGVAGGAGLWISSATQVPVLIGVGLGVLVAGWFFGQNAQKNRPPGRWAPELWRWWGMAGAGASLFFYLLEYFPSHLDFRLEVNHPLYAIAWFGGGEILFRVSRKMAGGDFAGSGRDSALAVGAVLGLALLPLVVLATSDRTFWVADRMLWALHSDYIVEFGSIFRRLAMVPVSRWPYVFNLLPFLVLFLSWLAFLGRLEVREKMSLFLVIVPALVLTMLAFYQVRWMGLSCAIWLAALAVVAEILFRRRAALVLPRRWRIVLILLGLVVALPWLVQFGRMGMIVLRSERGLSKMSLRMTIMRDLARWLRVREGGDRPCLVLGGPSISTAMIYYGGFRGVGTLYWENKDGLLASIDLFSTSKDSLAKDLITKRGITHIVVASWDAFAEEASRLALGLPRGAEPSDDTFLARLARGRGCPVWLRPVHFPGPRMDALEGEFVLVYEVVPELSREEAALRHAQVLIERGDHQNAVQFLNVLVRRYPGFLPGWVALAQLQVGMKDADGFKESLGRISDFDLKNQELALEDRIGLSMVYAAAGDVIRLRKQVRLCAEIANDKTLRHLDPGKLMGFVLLAAETDASANNPGLMAEAMALLPVHLQKQVLEMRGIR